MLDPHPPPPPALQLVNEKPSVINEYESGKAIPNPQVWGRGLGRGRKGAVQWRWPAAGAARGCQAVVPPALLPAARLPARC